MRRLLRALAYQVAGLGIVALFVAAVYLSLGTLYIIAAR
jgi:hypothetical protein